MKEVKKLVSLNVKDQPVSKVLETIQESLDQNLIYSKTVLSNQKGDEHLVTAKIEKVEPETALFMIIKTLGMVAEEFEDGHLIIRAPELEDDLNKDDMDLDEDFDGDMPF